MAIKEELIITLPDNTQATIMVHSEYSAGLSLQAMQEALYELAKGYVDGSYLARHPRETDEGYNYRKAVCWLPNYGRALIETYNNHIFKNTITRVSDDEGEKAFFEAADKSGRITMNELMKKLQVHASVYNRGYVLVDKPKMQASSLAEENLFGKPYAYLVKPADLFDWYKNADGEFEWVKIKEIHTRNADNPNGEYSSELRIWTWTRNEWYVTTSDGISIDGGVHNLGVVPIVQHNFTDSIVYQDVGTTPFRDIAQIMQSMFNKISQKDSLLYNQTFAILAIAKDSPDTKPSATDSDGDIIDTSTTANQPTLTDKTVVYVGDDAKHMPVFINPDGASVEAYTKEIAAMLENAKDIMKQNFSSGALKSGVAMAYDFEDTNTMLKESATRLASTEKSILDIRAKWLGQESEAQITYPEEFSVRDLLNEIRTIGETLSLGMSKTFNKEYKKAKVRVLQPGINEDALKVIDEEIEEGEEMMDIEGFEEGGDDEENQVDEEAPQV
jgi:hypothetical protein